LKSGPGKLDKVRPGLFRDQLIALRNVSWFPRNWAIFLWGRAVRWRVAMLSSIQQQRNSAPEG
jgi:hypothetical protein